MDMKEIIDSAQIRFKKNVDNVTEYLKNDIAQQMSVNPFKRKIHCYLNCADVILDGVVNNLITMGVSVKKKKTRWYNYWNGHVIVSGWEVINKD